MVLMTATLALLLALSLGLLLHQRQQRKVAEEKITRQLDELARAGRFALAGELSASIAHEVAQPLGAILSNADAAGLMLMDQPRTAELDSILADIRRDALRANQVVQRLRSLLQKHTPILSPLDLNATFDEALELLRPEARRRQISIDSALVPANVVVMGDHVQMQQVLLNLAINAMDAMEDTPLARRCVSIASDTTHGGYELHVADFGHGIRDEARERMFDPLFTTKPDGMGLGLSIVHSIVVAHGGTVRATAREDGGSVFTVWLPTTVPHKSMHTRAKPEHPAARATFKVQPATEGGHP